MPDAAATIEQIYTIWWFSLAIFLAVLVIVALLLNLVLRSVRHLESTVAEIWQAGQGIANNTVHIPLLMTTNRVVGTIGQEAGAILDDATRIQAHAEQCPGCPACVRASRQV